MTTSNASLTPPEPNPPVDKGSSGSTNALADQPWRGVWRDILGGNVVRSIVAIILALIIGMLIAVFTNKDVQDTLGYFFSRPGDFFNAAGSLIGDAVRAMITGAVYSPTRGFQPFLSSLQWATPLVAAGLGLGVAFRAGLFNIGGQGQMLVGALFASYVGASWNLPPVLHLIVAILAAVLGGAMWAAIVGFLKAQTGAHEVILTIMFNWIAHWGITYLLKQPLFQSENAPGFAKGKAVQATAVMPELFNGFGLGFVLVLLAAVLYWWIMDRSTVGFKIRAVGINPNAAKTAGINVKTVTVVTMAISGAFIGLAAATQTLEVHPTGIEPTIHAGIGFDAITVALLGGNSPVGIILAALLFGLLKAGSVTMEIQAGIPRDIIPVIQGLIVLFVAAPRFLGFLPRPTGVKIRDRVAAGKVKS
ncbi:ABC transporter permease [Gulosibacter molinativorax]|uniref:ABC transporter permease n=1 Tax=Gulosibacter molinativorax TaxID=256821 RepID=A0ABT7C828_9MICO|nr:ABC transporter permease [Gulosibacter molinativorax]MDJ1371348.1 ABC transporter permease [Gulosibacter molinativorax]QUY63588.1 ABC transporter permease [Gulosibacter molinativorax]